MITGSPPTAMKVGTPASSTIFLTLIPSAVVVGPMMAATLSLKMNFLAMTAALAGSLSVSPMTSSMGRPLMPPSLLILSTAIWATSFVGVPMLAAGPDRAKKAPTLMGSPANDAELTQHRTSATMTTIRVFMTIPPSYRLDAQQDSAKPAFPRLLKKVQMQGGTRKAERGVLQVRRNERLSGPTQQMGLFQQPPRRSDPGCEYQTPASSCARMRGSDPYSATSTSAVTMTRA